MNGSFLKAKFALRVYLMTTLSCLLNMVAGNLLLISLQHLWLASRVGLVCSGGFALFSLRTLKLVKNKYYLAVYVFVATTVVDFMTHESHFGGAYSEALSTGLCAALLSLIGSFILDRSPALDDVTTSAGESVEGLG